MQRAFAWTVRVLPLAVLFLFSAVPAIAHGVAYDMVDDTDVVTFKARYSNGEPIAYGKVLIYGPDEAKIEFQNGRTDRNGRFAFSPDREGLWSVVVDAGMGHRLEFTTDHGTVADQKSEPVRTSQTILTFLGLSLILNLFLIIDRFRKRSV